MRDKQIARGIIYAFIFIGLVFYATLRFVAGDWLLFALDVFVVLYMIIYLELFKSN